MEKAQTQVLSRARSIRLAFFVDLDESSHPILDAIFDYSFSIWGGRFSLVVPCTNGEPMATYLSWLKVFDPDLIYSYVDLPLAKQVELHEVLYPFALQHHWRGSDTAHVDHRPTPHVSPLAVGTVLPIAGQWNTSDGTRSARLVDAMGSRKEDRFLADSFGFMSAQLRNSMRSILSGYGSALVVVAQDELQPRQRYIHGAEETVADAGTLLATMTRDRRVVGVAQLSALQTPRTDLRSRRWGETFNIVIGDTVVDRLIYWNARALMPPWRDGSDVDLRIPRANFEDLVFVAALRDFMNRRNHVNGDSGNGPNKATLRSSSVSAQDLASFAEQMRHGQSWIVYGHEHVASIAECVPDTKSLEHGAFVVGQQGIGARSLWKESFSIEDELRLTSPVPEHLRHVPTALMSPLSGAWAVDLDIERSVDHSPYSNIRHRWQLPRRLRVTRAFRQGYQLTEPHGEVVDPRVSNGGLLTLFTAANVALPKITLPTDHDAILVGLQGGRDWRPFERFGEYSNQPQLCYEARRSSAGQYFWGVYQMFGDMNSARSVLLHEFWRKQLEDYGATDQRTEVRQEKMKSKLRQRIGDRQLNLADANQLHTLSNIVLQESDEVRMTVRSLNWTQFADDFKSLAKRFDETHPAPQGYGHDSADESRRRGAALRRSVQRLCKLGVLHQGYEHKCKQCLHRTWVAIADLKPGIVCEVCHSVRPAPVDQAWQFRLNGFVREALQRYGIGPLFWVLSRFQQRNGSSFWFEGPLDIYFDQAAAEAGQQETDIDLTMIDCGIVRMCEVKQSERQFKDPGGVARTMAKLRPDVAMIAVMEADSNALRGKFAEFSSVLAGTGIKPELLTLDAERDISSDPYL